MDLEQIANEMEKALTAFNKSHPLDDFSGDRKAWSRGWREGYEDAISHIRLAGSKNTQKKASQ